VVCRSPSLSLIRRGFWLTMLAGHAPALARRIAAMLAHGDVGAHLGTTIALAAATVFFLLKCCDVPWLRLRTDLRACCALLVLVGLMHADVIVRSAGDGLETPQALLAGGSAGLLTVVALHAATRGQWRRARHGPAPAVRWRPPVSDGAAPPPLERLHSPDCLRAPPLLS
jgi:hypothetical protein